MSEIPLALEPMLKSLLVHFPRVKSSDVEFLAGRMQVSVPYLNLRPLVPIVYWLSVITAVPTP